GAGLTRTERLAHIVENSALAPAIRVCWEHAATGENCGVCEKCITTQLNYRALGREPQGFRRIAGPARIAMIPVHGQGNLYFLRELQRTASRRRVRGWWRLAVRVAILRSILLRPVVLVTDAIKARIR